MNSENNNNQQQQTTPYDTGTNEREAQTSYTTDYEKDTASDRHSGEKPSSRRSASKGSSNMKGRRASNEPKTDAGTFEPTTESRDNASLDAYYEKRRNDITPNYLASVSSYKQKILVVEDEKFQELVAITRSTQPAKERIAAIRKLADYGQFITPNVLMLCMIDRDKYVRAAVLETCADLARYIPVKIVVAALADSSSLVRETALQALSQFGPQAPLQRIAAIADDEKESVQVRFWALYALGKLHDLKSTDRFLTILNNNATDEHLREAAAIALGLLGRTKSPLTLQLLRHTLTNEKENALVRIAAAHSLAQLSNPPEKETLHALTQVLKHKDEDIREAADHALDVIAEQVLSSIGKQSTPQSNTLLIEALLLLRDHISEGVLVGLLSHSDRAISQAALDMLVEDDETLPASHQAMVKYIYNGSTLSIQNKRENMRGLHHMTEGSFIPLAPGDLESAGIAQALDGRWIPRTLLSLMKERRLSAFDIRAYLDKQVRTEYIRSLLHNRSVTIALSLFYTNPIIFQDFLEGSSQREAFQWLLNTGVIVPILFEESTPDAPSRVVRSVVGLEAWQRICKEVRMACISLSKTKNKVFKRLLGDHMAQNAHLIAAQVQGQQNAHLIAAQVQGQQNATADTLEVNLRKLAAFVNSPEHNNLSLERLYETLYKRFVLVEDSSSRERIYDSNKDASYEIKQVIDLAYNASIADALQCHLLTPGDTLPRTTLQEWRTPPPALTIRYTLTALMNAIDSCQFDVVRSDWYLKSLRFLSLQDVIEIRASKKWETYMKSVESLMDNTSFVRNGLDTLASSLEFTYHSYQRLLDEINNMLEHQRTASTQHTFWTKWTPTPELQITVAGAILLIRWTQDGRLYSFTGRPTPGNEQQPAISITFSIGEHHNTLASTDLSMSFDLFHGRLDTSKEHASLQWSNLKNYFRAQPPSQLWQDGYMKTEPTLS